MKAHVLTMLLVLATGPVLAADSGASAWGACADCHEDAVAGFVHTTHARIRSFEVGGATTGCAACHGDTAAHLESGDTAGLHVFGEDPAADTDVCLACHGTRGASEWHASIHANELACTDCHSVHTRTAPDATCTSCHPEVGAQLHAPSHHPIREGGMTCASCHDVHRATEAALKTDMRANDLCISCHADKEGPFIFQHAPVEEDCMICHTPHGSVANNLLTANEPFLCMQCHEMHFHGGFRTVDEEGTVNVGGIPRANVEGEYGFVKAFGTRCTQCHTRIHGSDLPSNSVPGQGANLTR